MADCYESVIVQGTKVAYTDRGNGSNIILLLHGNPDSRHSWKPLMDQLLLSGQEDNNDEKKYRCIAPDLPGYGDSDPFPYYIDDKNNDAIFSIDRMSEFWNDFVNALNIVKDEQPIHIIVHDLGGPCLFPWLIKYPNRVASVIIINSIYHKDYKWHTWGRLWQTPILGEISMVLSNRYIMRYEIGKSAPNLTTNIIDDTYNRTHWTMRKTILRFYRAYANPNVIFDEDKLMSTLQQEKKDVCCVIWGDNDPYISKQYADRFVVKPIHMQQSSHWPQLEFPIETAKHVKEFWNSLGEKIK